MKNPRAEAGLLIPNQIFIVRVGLAVQFITDIPVKCNETKLIEL